MPKLPFSIEHQDIRTICSFIDFILKDVNNINTQDARWWLSTIIIEMKKYENEGCNAVIKLCQKMKKTSYSNEIIIIFEISNLIQAVNAVSTNAIRKVIIKEFIIDEWIHEASN